MALHFEAGKYAAQYFGYLRRQIEEYRGTDHKNPTYFLVGSLQVLKFYNLY